MRLIHGDIIKAEDLRKGLKVRFTPEFIKIVSKVNPFLKEGKYIISSVGRLIVYKGTKTGKDFRAVIIGIDEWWVGEDGIHPNWQVPVLTYAGDIPSRSLIVNILFKER